ncbi:hypothetical protein MPCS_01374 [Candidatus Megaera polyxenophila]|jgi:hypothetical protein|nr:hypothetical protein MPCS_01374 [Candidatus Megaera polyxenophila]
MILLRTKYTSSKVVTGAYKKCLRWLELNESKDSRSVPRGVDSYG